MSKTQLAEILAFMESFAPLDLAEEWDNVGLLLGDRSKEIQRGLTCLTITAEVVAEAIESKVDLIVSHHPMPFRALKKITTDTVTGRMVLDLIRHEVAVYSPHTAFDSTSGGINQMIAERIQMREIRPLIDKPAQPLSGPLESSNETVFGVGRVGELAEPQSCQEFAKLLADQFKLKTIKVSGNSTGSINRIGIACGSAGQFLSNALSLGCDAFITGETSFHTCLDARANNISLFLLGHFGSERFAVEALADILGQEFSNLSISASSSEKDPVEYWNFD